jgi:multiple sugar transport system permease protein
MATATTAPATRAGGRGLSQRRVEAILGWVFALPYVIHFVVLDVGAILFAFGLSFFETDLLTGFNFMCVAPVSDCFDNYRSLLTEEPLFYKALTNTALYTLISVPLATTLALLIAVLLNQNIKGQGIFRTLFYMPALVTGVAVAIVWLMVLQPDYGISAIVFGAFGLKSPGWFWSEEWALPGLALIALWGAGTNMLLYLAGLQSVPTHLQEAARIDGANSFRVFWSITLPMLTPTILFNVITNMIASFQVFTSSFVLTNGGPNNATLMYVLYLYNNAFRFFKLGKASAMAWILFVILLVFTVIQFKNASKWVYYEGGERE